MALRIKTAVGAGLILTAAACFAQPFSFEVQHQHLHKGAMGTLRITLDSISFDEPGKTHQHSREWKYDDIQQLFLSPTTLRILTYQDQKWQLGRDNEYTFDHLPKELSETLYPMFSAKLDQRFIAALADPNIRPQWQMPVKLRHGRGGSQGALLVGDDRIVYKSDDADESRTWRLTDIDSISLSGPFDFSITTLERSGWRHSGPTEFRFQLKEPLAENRYNELWRKLEDVKSRTAF